MINSNTAIILSTEEAIPSSEDLIIENCKKYPITAHPFFQRLRSEPPNLTAYWAYFANLEPLSIKTADWFANILVHVDNIRLKSILSSIIYDEMGRGDMNQIHCLLLEKLVKGLEPWRVQKSNLDVLYPGKNLAEEFDKLCLGDNIDKFVVLGSIIGGEVHGGQMASFMGQEVRRQKELDLSIFEWATLHEEVEGEHTQKSGVMSKFLPSSGTGFESVMAGAKWENDTFWQWLDGIHNIAYGEEPKLVSV